MASAPSRPPLLFLAPVVPRSAGNGLAMRSFLFLDALAAQHEIHLHVIPVSEAAPLPRPSAELKARVACVTVHDLPAERREYRAFAETADPVQRAARLAALPWPIACRFETGAVCRAILEATPKPALLHVARGYLAPFLAPLLEAWPRPALTLDLDDYESATHAAFAALARTRGDAAADHWRLEADRYRRLEAQILPQIDRVFVANPTDRARLAARFGQAERFVHVPNAAPPVPQTRQKPRLRWMPRPPLRLLFVGTLGYLPNEDAVAWLCAEILPRLRDRLGARAVSLRVAGARPSRRLRGDIRAARAGLSANPADLAPLYAEATLAVAPIRAGGGSRIKILEAFLHRRPVVATRAAADGLEVEDGTHLCLADDPDAFAAACARLAAEPDRAREIADRAHAFAIARHDPALIGARIRASLPPPPG
ncbi:MAG: glycosyltransferase [Paracoccaceae bacterium]